MSKMDKNRKIVWIIIGVIVIFIAAFLLVPGVGSSILSWITGVPQPCAITPYIYCFGSGL